MTESAQMTNVPDGWKPTGGSDTIPKLTVPTSIDSLDDSENALLAELAEVWTRHATRNHKLTAYYEAKEPLVDFGLTIPQSIKDHYTPLGWARKAVDMLAELCVFEGFVSPGVDDPFRLQDFMSRIGFTSVLQQAIQTALIHGCSFLSVIPDAHGGKFGSGLGLSEPACEGMHGHNGRGQGQSGHGTHPVYAEPEHQRHPGPWHVGRQRSAAYRRWVLRVPSRLQGHRSQTIRQIPHQQGRDKHHRRCEPYHRPRRGERGILRVPENPAHGHQ